MNTALPLRLLGDISPDQFMRQYWQRQPLLVRGAIADFQPLLSRAQLVALAAQDDVESRLITAGTARGWTFARGPFTRSRIPPFKQPQWTLLVQGVDLHHDGAHALMQQFRFVPDARLDDLMMSYATDGGGVGPHFDSYDVFLIQAHGQRRWRIGRQKDQRLIDGLPVRILAQFEPEQDFVVNPGDLLYLPPGWAHDGIAVGECMTYSVGFKVPQKGDVARELLLRMADAAADSLGESLYNDATQAAVQTPAAIPEAMQDFAARAVQAAASDTANLHCALGEYLTDPKAHVWFTPLQEPPTLAHLRQGVRLHRQTHMLYDSHHIFINGESYRAAGQDAYTMQTLANQRTLGAQDIQQLSPEAQELLLQWVLAGWVQSCGM